VWAAATLKLSEMGIPIKSAMAIATARATTIAKQCVFAIATEWVTTIATAEL
jgi:hypothetical protein